MVDTTTSPYSAIVRITGRNPAYSFAASGVLISPDEVLTSAHVAFDSVYGVATSITVTPGYDSGAAPYGTFSGAVTHYQPINDFNDLISLSDSQRDYAVIHLTAPVQGAATMTLGADYSGGVATTSGYPGAAGGAQVDSQQSFSTVPFYTLLKSGLLGPGSSGGPVWTGDGTIVGLTSSGSTVTNTGYYTQITTSVRSTILNWMAQDDGYATVASYYNGKTGISGTIALSGVATGGPSYLQWQYIWSSPDSVALSTSAPNVFLHGGPGQDSLQVTSGQNVLDGGTGSNFMTGGTGNDTFFTDARGTAVVWNTLQNFHQGDAATLWGFVPGVSSYRWDATEAGAAGHTGATLRANIIGGNGRTGDGIDASITFAGLSVTQAKQLQLSTGTQGAGPYLAFYNQGV